MDNLEIKNIKKQISLQLTRKKENKTIKLIESFLERLKEENSLQTYESEAKALFKNVRNYYFRVNKNIPVSFYDFCVEVAKIYEKEDNLQAAEDTIISSISFIQDREKIAEIEQSSSEELKSIRNELIHIKALKVEKGEEKPSQAIKDVNDILSQKNIDPINEYELFVSLSKEIATEELEGTLFPEHETNIKRGPRENGNGTNKSEEEDIPFYLSPFHRLEFFKKEFPGMKIRKGQGKFSEYCVIEVPDLDSVIVEKFFKKNRDGKLTISQGTDATYIVPKEFVLDLLSISKSEVREFARDVDERIKVVNHTAKTRGKFLDDSGEINYNEINYYRRIKTKFNASIGREYFAGFGLDDRIPIRKNREKNREYTGRIEQTKEKNGTNSYIPEINQGDNNRKKLLQEIIDLTAEIKRLNTMLRNIRAQNKEDENTKQQLIEAIEKLENTQEKFENLDK